MAKKKVKKREPEIPALRGVLAAFTNELVSMQGELDAYRRLGAEIGEWLKMTGNLTIFEKWRADRNKSDQESVGGG